MKRTYSLLLPFHRNYSRPSFLLLLAGLALVSNNCAMPPERSQQTALNQGKLALQARADQYAPSEYRQYRYAYRRAQRFQMEEDIKFFPFLRDYSYVVEAYQLSRQRGEEARQAALDQQQELSQEIRDMMDSATEDYRQIKDLVNGVSAGKTSRSLLAEADILIHQAGDLMQIGEYEKAKSAAVRGMAKINAVQNRASMALNRLQSKELLARWDQWVETTISWSRENDSSAVVVDKSRHTCMVFHAGKMIKSYRVDLGVSGFSQKMAAGDLATPEGQYYITRKQGVGQSRYYKGLMLSYPNEQDRQRFQQAKNNRQISPSARIGGNIMLHGEGGKEKDWTLGCVALANDDMDELFDLVQLNTPVTIVGRVPSRFSIPVSKSQDMVEKTRELQSKKKQFRLL